MDERRTIEAAKRGDARAERALYDAHVERVWRLAYRMTRDETLAEDMVQETFLKAFTRLGDFRGEAAFSSWLHGIAVSLILNMLRDTRKRRDHEDLREDLTTLSAASRRERPDLRRRLTTAVASLDDAHRLVFVMHDLEGYTHEEISSSLGTAVGTSKARLSRARGRLRELLQGWNDRRLELET